MPKKVGNQEPHPKFEEEVVTISFKSASIEVTILPVDLQWLPKTKKKTAQTISIILLNLLHGLIACLMLSLKLEPINLFLADKLLVLIHLQLKI